MGGIMYSRYKKNTVTIIVLLFLVFSSANSQVKTFNIKESIEVALENNYGLAVAEAQKMESFHNVGIQRTNMFPTLITNFNYTRLDVAPFFPTSTFAKLGGVQPGGDTQPIEDMPKKITIGDDKNYSIGLSLRQPIFTGGKIKGSYNIAQYGALAADAEFEKKKRDLALEVKTAFWNVLKAFEYRKLMENSKKQVESHLQDVKNMYKVGMVTENDLLRTKVQLSKIEIEVIKSKHGLKLAKTSFCNVLGIPLDTKFELKEDVAVTKNFNIELDEALKKALKNREEIEALNYNLKIANESVKISKAGYFPDIFLVADYSYRRPNRQYEKEFYNTWTVSLNAQFNIFDWGKTSYQISQAKSRKNQVENSLKQLKNGIKLEVTNAYYKLIEAKEKVTASELNKQQAKENFRVTNELFKQGLVSNTDLLDAQTLLTQAESEYINSKLELKLSIANLLKAMGE